MLVLSRKINETILIGNDITVEVLGIDRGKIRLGITAPKNVKVLRSELLESKPEGDDDAVGDQANPS